LDWIARLPLVGAPGTDLFFAEFFQIHLLQPRHANFFAVCSNASASTVETVPNWAKVQSKSAFVGYVGVTQGDGDGTEDTKRCHHGYQLY
jgi:hypothetical protein